MDASMRAAELDANRRLREAAAAYENILAEERGSLETYLNLAVLYFVCRQFPRISQYRLGGDEFVRHAWRRANELLDEAEAKFGYHSEVDFWRRYFSFVIHGKSVPSEVWEQIAHQGQSLVPFFYTFMASAGKKYGEQATRLFQQVSDGSTERKRYIRSILESYLT